VTEENAPEVSVVLPAHNEVGLLGSTVTNLITGLEARGLSHELLVVENGSQDGTLRLSRLVAAQFSTVRVLSLSRGDYGEALAAGFAEARGHLVASFDVDYYDLAFFDRARALLNDGADLVLASKRAPGANDRRPLVRRVLTAGFNSLLRLVLDLKVSDAHGMKVFTRETLAPLAARCTMRASMFDVELVLRAERAGLRVLEVPAQVFERRPPRSSVGRRALESLGGVLLLRARVTLEQSEQTARLRARLRRLGTRE